MDGSFDPYAEWLGMADGPRPPHYYELLGIAAGEHNLAVILAAADQRIARLRGLSDHDRRELAQQLLAELSSAKLCLLDPVAKARYDAGLGIEASQAATGAMPARHRRAGYQPAMRRPRRRFAGIAAGLIGLALLAILTMSFWNWPSDESASTSPPVADTPVVSGPQPADEQPKDDQEPVPSQPSSPVSAPPVNTPNARIAADPASPGPSAASDVATTLTPTVPAAIAADSHPNPLPELASELSAEVKVLVMSAIELSANRKLDRARSQLSEVSTTALTPWDRRAVESWLECLTELERFWQAVPKGAQTLRAGDTILLADGVYTFQGAEGEKLNVMAANGQTRTFSLNMEQIEASLADVLSSRGMALSVPRWQLTRACFWLCDRAGDRDKGLQLAKEAAELGLPTDFLPLPREQTSHGAEVPATHATHAAHRAPPKQPSADPQPQEIIATETSGRQVPSDQELAEKLDTFRATHAAEYYNRDREERAAFARRLLEASRQTKHSRIERYILLNEARQIANRASDVETMLQAGRELASQFDVDTAALAAAGVRDVLLRPVEPALRSTILEQIRNVMVQWTADGKRADAQKLLTNAIDLMNTVPPKDENTADSEVTQTALRFLQSLAEQIHEGNAGS